MSDDRATRATGGDGVIDAGSVRVGTQLPEHTYGPISLTDIVRYQGASHDFNPIHHDADLATGAGFPKPIVPGMMAMGYLTNILLDAFGLRAIRELDGRFSSVMFPGDVLECRGVVTEVDEEDGGRRLTVELECSTERGVAITVTALIADASQAQAGLTAEG